MSETRYKFLVVRDGELRSRSGDVTWRLHAWQRLPMLPMPNASGFHCARSRVGALCSGTGSILAEVAVSGASVSYPGGDHEKWQEMCVLHAWHWTARDSIALAMFTAEQAYRVVEVAHPDDHRPRLAVLAIQNWLVSPSSATLTNAEHAAYLAAEAARESDPAVAWAAWTCAQAAGAIGAAVPHIGALRALSAVHFGNPAILIHAEQWLATHLTTLPHWMRMADDE